MRGIFRRRARGYASPPEPLRELPPVPDGPAPGSVLTWPEGALETWTTSPPLSFDSHSFTPPRLSAQDRLRAAATELEGHSQGLVKFGGPYGIDVEMPTVTADQLRLVADLLDNPTWGMP